MSRPSIVVLGASIAEIVSGARAAEDAGFESVWAAEFYDRSATVALAAIAQGTSRVEIGSGIAYAFGRTPLVLAAEARDIDELSGGRLILGLGTGTRRMQQDWHGLDGEHTAPRIEELIPLLRRLWRLHEGPVEHEGRFYRVRVRPTAIVHPPVRPDIPVYLAAVNPRMCEAAGAVGDGLVGHPLFTPEYVGDVVRPALARGAARTGRTSPPIAGYLTCSVDADREQARRDAAALIAFNSTVKTYDAIHRHMGFEAEADAIRGAWRSGDLAGMIAGVSERMIDAVALAGTADEVRDRFASRWDGVYERVLLWPPAHRGVAGARAVVETFAM